MKKSLIFIIFVLFAVTGQNKQIIKTISSKDGFNMIEQNKDNKNFIIIDVRTPDEYREGHVKGALNVDFYASNFVDLLKKFDLNKKYLIYCRSGSRSSKTLPMMKEIGFMEVYDMGGFNSWVSAGYPVVK